ncbi:MAG: SpoIIE family protein phosphatase [bacterium]|nr:SpoIIE family protein phosphatase [bacterium]
MAGHFQHVRESAVADKEGGLNSFRRAMAGLAGLLLLMLVTAFAVHEQSALTRLKTSGTLQSEHEWRVTEAGDSVRVATRIDSVDFYPWPVPSVGDTVIRIGGQPLTPTYWREVFNRVMPPDTEIAVTYSGATGLLQTTLHFVPEPTRTFGLIVLIDVLRFLVAIGFLGVGLWAFFAQPNSSQVRVFAWFCFGMTAAMLAGVNVAADRYSSFVIPYKQQIEGALGTFALGIGTLWLHLQLVFPRQLGFLSRHGRWLYPAIYVPWLLLIVLSAMAALDANSGVNRWANVIVILQALLLLIGFVILGWRFVKATDRLEKRQLRLVLWGTGVGIGGFIALIVLTNLIRGWFTEDPMRLMLVIIAGFTLLLLTPITFAYAFTLYRLLEVQGKLKRGTRYLIAAVLAFGGLFVVMYFVGNYTLFGSGAAGNPWAMVLVMLFAVAMGRVSHRLTKILEKRFYPERQQLRSNLESAIERSSSFGDCDQFWAELSENLRRTLNVETVNPVLATANELGFAMHNRGVTPFLQSSELVMRLSRERKPILVDELLATGRGLLTAEEEHWLSANNVALVLPLMTQRSMMGFLALGFKTEEEDYAPEEISVLTTLAPQVAMASENLRLLEENVEKRRLEEQMQMARRIQEGFLPSVLPVTPGLELATHNRFSLDVAGDYFDVIPLSDGETLVAIADVSGKGAGAALLMANLQASLRMAMEVGVPLTRSVAQVNNLIFRNTPPEQYITFVAVMFDPRTSRLRYVNAGHNPPLVIRMNGAAEEIPPTGLILGAIPNVSYDEGVIELRQGDLVVLYTDGVSEAMNDAEEEYGEGRIVNLSVKLRAEIPQRIVEELERDVERFCGRVPMEDDSTLVVLKRL